MNSMKNDTREDHLEGDDVVLTKMRKKLLDCERLLYEIRRDRQSEFKGMHICTNCTCILGRIRNTGNPCPTCGYMICKDCRIPLNSSNKFHCKVCEMKCAIDKRARRYGYSSPLLPVIPPNYAASITSSTKTKFVGCTRGRSLFKWYILAVMIEEFLALRHPARQPKMTCPLTITSTPNKGHSGGNTKSSASFQPPPTSTSHKTTLSPTHSLSPFQAITRKPTKIPSQCAPAKVLSSSCMSAPNRNCMDNQQEKAMIPVEEEHVPFPLPSKEPTKSSLLSVSLKDSLPHHSSSEDERETVSSICPSVPQSGTQDDSCVLHKAKNSFGRGDVMFGVTFKEGELVVRVCKCRDLAATKSKGYYIKTYLLPDQNKLSKQKTDVKRRTNCPEYNAFMKYKMKVSELKLVTLSVSVWDMNWCGKKRFLSEVRFPLSALDLTNATNHWYSLEDKMVMDFQYACKPPSKINLPHQPADHKKVMRRRTRAPNRLRCGKYIPGQEYEQLIGESESL